ncbi:cupredoxin domain-containing protein [Bacillus sp. FJAT-50079]|uniref:cupredoxin domain-containing protein n=1 Tax=Bacillus sp. FJAT-50079 TaxID=2833577 RepID=UPI001BCA4668|nr:cupredoxin domain-containing protein [Bacillus sp. FJAT-50079]MBS4209416.1 cupredoxin domain-containing protein [Bacillus sp. FJAT-50079]
MKKWFSALLIAIVAILALSACGSKSEDATGTGEVKEFTIEASNFDFDLKEIKVNKGDTVKVTLKNVEGMHAVEFEGYKKEVKADETITFVADKAGEFEYICSIFCGAGHNDMVGKLIVEE